MEANTLDPGLASQLSKANKIFRRKDYFQSLQKYSECLRMIPRGSSGSGSMEDLQMSIYSLRGMNYSAIREFEKAESDFTYVLERKPYDATTLMRRASLNLKLKQYKKAMADITRLVEIEPDSIRVAALMLEAKDKLAKMAGEEHKDELNRALDDINNLNTDDLDEEEMLNFCNLRKIDRKSVSLAPVKGRPSQVCFKQDTQNIYESSEDPTPYPKIPQKFTATEIHNILESQKKDIIQPDKDRYKISIICKPIHHKKSILKNSSIRIALPTNSQIESTNTETMLNIENVRDIEGKPIRNSMSKVKFRKSEIDPRQLPFASMEIKKKPSRKSCLKQSSFGLQTPNGKPPVMAYEDRESCTAEKASASGSSGRASRNQSFLHLKMDLADGKLLSKSEGFTRKKERNEDGEQESAKSFDSGDQYNIFGCDGSVEISDKMKRTLGLEESQSNKENSNSQETSKAPKPSKMAKKSILKKNSVLKDSSSAQVATLSSVSDPTNTVASQLKAKKSVLFK